MMLDSACRKCGVVALVGRPSVGKSTLLNKLCSQKVSIVSKMPQTTRNAIRGIVNRAQGQLVFIDTPGRHIQTKGLSQKKFNKKLKEVSDRALEECDLVLYVLDATRAPGIEEEEIVAALAPLAGKTVAAINKIDAPNADTAKLKDFLLSFSSSSSVIYAPRITPRAGFDNSRLFQISAKSGEGTEELLNALFSLAPQGEIHYGEDYYTDQETGFRITEIIRGHAINRLREELPHSLYVDIADMEYKETENKLWVRAFIMVERESQKGIVVGKGGEMIRKIRLAAIKDLKRIFDWKIDLDLRVKTGKDWRSKDHVLRKIIER